MSAVFDAHWLALREAADHRARSPVALDLIRHRLPNGRAIGVLDVGSGSGSNLRHLAPRLAAPQRWHLFDHDATLLAIAAESAGDVRGAGGEPVEARARHTDLAELPNGWPERVDLVTASALLDLCGHEWLEALARYCSKRRAPALITLSYDGHFRFTDHDADDEHVRAAVNRHQRSDKGLGTALGPGAARAAARAFAVAGHAAALLPSPWILRPGDEPLRASLVDGWAVAAAEQQPARAAAIERWRRRRRDGDPAALWVGHLDLCAWPVTA